MNRHIALGPDKKLTGFKLLARLEHSFRRLRLFVVMWYLRDTSRSRHAPQGLSPASKPCRPLNYASILTCSPSIDQLRLVMFPHDSPFLAIPVAVLFRGALVVNLFTGHQRELAFDLVAFPVKLEWHAGVALVLGDREQLGDLFAMQQQLSRARGVSDFMGAGGIQRHDMAAQQPGFTIANQDIGVGELCFTSAKAFDLPSCQRKARFEGFVDVVLKACLLVLGYNVAGRAFALSFFRGHETSYSICL